MYTVFWSPKGGVGVTTVTALFALASAERAEPTLVVDTQGDLAAVLGVADPDGPGVRDWAATPGRGADALRRICTGVGPDLHLLHPGDASWPDDATSLHTALEQRADAVFVDAGRATTPYLGALVALAPRRLLVVRNCYLCLRRMRDLEPAPTAIVMVSERGRSLGVGDAESVVGVPVVAEIAVDVAVARCLDAGLSATRLPRGLLRSLSRVSLDA